jgi:hypothetical protein
LAIALTGAALQLNLGGSAGFVIGRLTSRSLGSLAPGFAASRLGFKVYANLILAIGLVILAVGTLDWSPLAGTVLLGLGVLLFALDSVVVIVGEVRTFRDLKR